MNLFIRLIWLLLTVRNRGPMGVEDEGRVTLRCWPNDLDMNMHMNNGRYLTIMDLGRIDLIARTGLWPVMKARKWYPVVGTAKITFRRSISVFETFDLTTKIIGWDEKWLYIEHRMEKGDKLLARGVIKGIFLSPDGKVPMAELISAMGYEGSAPEMDPELAAALG